MKSFNITGTCFPEMHYMVNIDRQLNDIKKMIDNGFYFVINRARQYGKTTTLTSLKKMLENQYHILFISFEGLSEEVFKSEITFCRRFYSLVSRAIKYNKVLRLPDKVIQSCNDLKSLDSEDNNFFTLSEFMIDMCTEAKYPVVLLIDEVDQASNHTCFLNFLGVLRDLYLHRQDYPTFLSVILAGVYDIKNLKLKIRKENEHQYNSPWNIAKEFNTEMGFNEKEIVAMLKEYETDNHTGMDINDISRIIYDYTSGYPFLVSRICNIIDEILINMERFPNKKLAWTREGVQAAVNLLLKEKNTLFDDMVKHIEEYKELAIMLQNIVFKNHNYLFHIDHFEINIGVMFGFIKKVDNYVAIANRIFEMRISDLFVLDELVHVDTSYVNLLENQFIKNGYLDMDHVMEKFAIYYTDIYNDSDQQFLEEDGCKLFLIYLRPIINGTGNFYKEAQTMDASRMDLVVDYLGKQYVIELKIWHGKQYNQDGQKQLLSYLKFYHLTKGYLLTFNFNKKKKTGTRLVTIDGIEILETVV